MFFYYRLNGYYRQRVCYIEKSLLFCVITSLYRSVLLIKIRKLQLLKALLKLILIDYNHNCSYY